MQKIPFALRKLKPVHREKFISDPKHPLNELIMI